MEERADEAHRDPSLVHVTLTMAILAVVVATVSLLGHRALTEELLLQNKSTDQWAFYQAMNIRRHSYEAFLDSLLVSELKDADLAEKMKQNYEHEIEHYKDEQKKIESEARKLMEEVSLARMKRDRFDLGEVFLESALV